MFNGESMPHVVKLAQLNMGNGMEPTTTTAASGFIATKIYWGLSALFMAMVVLFLKKQKTLAGHGKVATAAIVSGVSVGSSVIFGGSLAIWFGMNPDDVNTAMSLGGAIGLVSFTIIASLVRCLDRLEGKDIVEVAQEVKADVAKVRAPAKKVPAKKTTRKAK